MASIEEKRLALEMTDKIIQVRINSVGSTYLRDKTQVGNVVFWKDIYSECLKIITEDHQLENLSKKDS